MPHHYTKDTTSAPAWCNHCWRNTQHSVSDGRLGRCMEHAAPYLSKAQEAKLKKQQKERINPRLF
jgi:hypothetical protein